MPKFDVEWVYNNRGEVEEVEAETADAAKEVIRARYAERLGRDYDPEKLIILGVEAA